MDNLIISENSGNDNREAMAEAKACAMAEHHTRHVDELGLSDTAAERATRHRFRQMEQESALQLPDPDIYLEIAGITWRTSEMTISETANPHRVATHTPTDWQFFAEGHEPMAFAISPTSGLYLVDGAPGRCIIELLDGNLMPAPPLVACADCGAELQPEYAPHIPGVGHVCYSCLKYYVDQPLLLPDSIEERHHA